MFFFFLGGGEITVSTGFHGGGEGGGGGGFGGFQAFCASGSNRA